MSYAGKNSDVPVVRLRNDNRPQRRPNLHLRSRIEFAAHEFIGFISWNPGACKSATVASIYHVLFDQHFRRPPANLLHGHGGMIFHITKDSIPHRCLRSGLVDLHEQFGQRVGGGETAIVVGV